MSGTGAWKAQRQFIDKHSSRSIINSCSTELGVKEQELDVKEQECKDSLAPPNLTGISDFRIPETKGTCTWIFSVQQYSTWRNGLPPVLWITGEMGCGKTTLMHFLKTQMQWRGGVFDVGGEIPTICSFFCDDTNKDLVNITRLLQSLVWDIIKDRNDLIHHVVEARKRDRSWSYNNLWLLLQAILDDPRTSNVYVIIDALDECDRKDRQKLLGDLGEYLERRSKTAQRSINLVLSGRPAITGDLRKLNTNPSCLKLDEDPVLAKHIATDIRQFVLEDLRCDNRFSDDELEALADKIATKSNGYFLWAALVLEDLHRMSYTNTKKFDDFVQKCPQDLHSVYYECFANVDNNDYKITLKSLHIILAAKRPLTTSEFKAAFAVNNGHRWFKELKKDMDQGRIVPHLQEKLGGLIRVFEDKVTFRHQSVKDFLLKRLGPPQDSLISRSPEHDSDSSAVFQTSMKQAEKTLAGCCIAFLNLRDFTKKMVFKDEDKQVLYESGLGAISLDEDVIELPDSTPCDIEPQAPFFEYAASNWGFHYASSESDSGELTESALKILKGTPLDNWSRQFKNSYWGQDNLPQFPDDLLVAAYFGLTSVIRKLTSDISEKEKLATGLIWASRMGHSVIVKIFIQLGTPWKDARLDGRSAFTWATAGGFCEIVDIFLEHDRDLINIKDNQGHSPLSLAVDRGHLEIVERFLKAENVDVNIKGSDGSTPIHYAVLVPKYSVSERGILRKLLDDHRVDITIREKRNRSILSWAAECGATEAVEEILGCYGQKDIESLLDDGGDNEGVSPLSYAAYNGHSDIVHLLCDTKQIDKQLQSVDKRDGDNVYARAVRALVPRGKVEVIRELGRYYRDGVDSRDKTGRTPLSTAMWENDRAVVSELLALGADCNLADFQGRTPVSYGTTQVELVRILIEHGADIQRADSDGRTPVSYGVRNIELVRLLVEHGADINLADKNGRTPLWWARDIENEDLKAQLVELGAHL